MPLSCALKFLVLQRLLQENLMMRWEQMLLRVTADFYADATATIMLLPVWQPQLYAEDCLQEAAECFCNDVQVLHVFFVCSSFRGYLMPWRQSLQENRNQNALHWHKAKLLSTECSDEMLGKGKQAHSTECSDEIQKGKEEDIQRSGDSPASDNLLGAQYAKNSYRIPPLISFFCSIAPLSASPKSFRIGIEVDEHRNPHHLRLGDECATRQSIIAFPWSASSAPEIQDTCYSVLYPSKHSASGLRLRIGILSICGRRRRVPYNKNTQWCSISLSLSLSLSL